jgi:hypothetical protein
MLDSKYPSLLSSWIKFTHNREIVLNGIILSAGTGDFGLRTPISGSMGRRDRCGSYIDLKIRLPLEEEGKVTRPRVSAGESVPPLSGARSLPGRGKLSMRRRYPTMSHASQGGVI